MVENIGKALGNLESFDVTTSSTRIRVNLDGLQPLIQETVIEFERGEEAIVSLVYERLKNHCSRCFRLTHEARDCPKKELAAHNNNYEYSHNKDPKPHRLSPAQAP